MKAYPQNSSSRKSGFRNPAPAFTLPELMTVVAIFSVLVVGMVSSQLFGMRMCSVSQGKLNMTAGARTFLSRVRDEIRSAQLVYVGNGDSFGFTPAADNTPHAGNALKICASAADTNQFVYYFLDPADSSLKRMVNALGSQAEVLANSVTNSPVFQAEDFQGNVLTQDQPNRAIGINLQFQRWEYPMSGVSNGPLYGYYQLQTRVSPRPRTN